MVGNGSNWSHLGCLLDHLVHLFAVIGTVLVTAGIAVSIAMAASAAATASMAAIGGSIFQDDLDELRRATTTAASM